MKWTLNLFPIVLISHIRQKFGRVKAGPWFHWFDFVWDEMNSEGRMDWDITLLIIPHIIVGMAPKRRKKKKEWIMYLVGCGVPWFVFLNIKVTLGLVDQNAFFHTHAYTNMTHFWPLGHNFEWYDRHTSEFY